MVYFNIRLVCTKIRLNLTVIYDLYWNVITTYVMC